MFRIRSKLAPSNVNSLPGLNSHQSTIQALHLAKILERPRHPQRLGCLQTTGSYLLIVEES